MVLLSLSLLIVAQPQPEVKLAAPGLTTSGLEASLAGPLTDHLARAFTGVRVITPRDISVLLGLERQKQLLGCGDDANACMAELGNALGVQGVLLGDVVKLGKAVQINVRIIDPVAGREIATASMRVDGEDEIFDALTRAGRQLRVQFLTALGRPPAPEEPVAVASTKSRGARRFSPIPLALGGAALVAGAVCFGIAEGAWQRLTSGPAASLTQAEATGLARNGQQLQLIGATLVTVGAAAVATGVALLLFAGPADANQPVAALGVGPGSIVLIGSF